ncbi:MAG: hypothetical protein IPI85_06955 [Dehalococcoidia bacterium]|nr:hypothetical protein [Dehalococcoidia bacterium]
MSPERPLLTFDMDGVLCRPPFGINPGSGRHKRRDAPGQKGLLWATESWRYHFRKPMPGAVEGYKEPGTGIRVCGGNCAGRAGRRTHARVV